MTQESIRDLIRKTGKECTPARGRIKKVSKVTCWICGKEIRSDTTEPLEASLTKRGSVLIWHPKCTKLVNDRKIPKDAWEDKP